MSTCAAKGCFIEIGPRLLFCFYHWGMVSRTIKLRIAHAATPGEKRRAVIDAIVAVNEREGKHEGSVSSTTS